MPKKKIKRAKKTYVAILRVSFVSTDDDPAADRAASIAEDVAKEHDVLSVTVSEVTQPSADNSSEDEESSTAQDYTSADDIED